MYKRQFIQCCKGILFYISLEKEMIRKVKRIEHFINKECPWVYLCFCFTPYQTTLSFTVCDGVKSIVLSCSQLYTLLLLYRFLWLCLETFCVFLVSLKFVKSNTNLYASLVIGRFLLNKKFAKLYFSISYVEIPYTFTILFSFTILKLFWHSVNSFQISFCNFS